VGVCLIVNSIPRPEAIPPFRHSSPLIRSLLTFALSPPPHKESVKENEKERRRKERDRDELLPLGSLTFALYASLSLSLSWLLLCFTVLSRRSHSLSSRPPRVQRGQGCEIVLLSLLLNGIIFSDESQYTTRGPPRRVFGELA
jgi:hypothetical protein